LSFTPPAVTVNQGEMVTWNNAGGLHNVKFDDGSYEQPANPDGSAWSVSRNFFEVGTFGYYCELHGGPGGSGMAGTVTVAAVPFPRPGAATPLRVPLVPEYKQCVTANRTHVSPLTLPSCDPPVEESTLLTTPNNGSGAGFVRIRALPGNAGTVPDEADYNIVTSATQVRRKSDNTLYTGKAILNTAFRMTDRANGPGVNGAGTVSDSQLSLPVDCTSGTCSLNSSADALVPNFAQEGKRAVIQSFSVNLKDAGADASIGTPTCGPNCGTGDEKVFLRQGVFLP
jgi:hypothetical protein